MNVKTLQLIELTKVDLEVAVSLYLQNRGQISKDHIATWNSGNSRFLPDACFAAFEISPTPQPAEPAATPETQTQSAAV